MNDLEKIKPELSQFDLRTKAQQASQSQAFGFVKEREVSRKDIDIFDCFDGTTLTSGQEVIVKQINDFLTDKTLNVFLLNGYAGTGKTFITKGITQYLEKIDRRFTLMAPTGKAAKVISDKTGQEASTIHRVIYDYDTIKEYKVDGVNGSETYRCYAELKPNSDTSETVYIIDEASMVSDRYSDAEFFRFGSGYLLKDLLQFINIDHNDHNKKIIFIGDDAQLPPIGMTTSPALDPDYLNRYKLTVTSGFLTEVVRQKGNSGVLLNASMLRDSLKQNLFNKLQLDINQQDVIQLNSDDLLNTFLATCEGQIGKTGECIIIAFSNGQVSSYNRLIREHFFNGQEEIARGDKIISVANHYLCHTCITNGEFGMISKILSPHSESISVFISVKGDNGEMVKRQINLNFRDVELGFRDADGKPFYFEAKIIENLLYNDQATLSSDEHKALYVDFLNRHPELKRKGYEQAKKKALMEDPYFNAFKIKFGYAITGHKAQGSEWKNVFLQCQTPQKTLTKEHFRWLYTAITRTSNALYVINPPNIALGTGMKIVGSYAPKPLSMPSNIPISQSDNSKDVYQAQEMAFPVNLFDFQSDIPQLQCLYKLVVEGINGTGISITDVLHYNYQERYIFKRGNEQTSINFNYKGNWRVSHVKSLGRGGLDAELSTLLAQIDGVLLNLNEPKEVTNFTFSESFLNEFYQNISSQLTGSGILVTQIDSRSFCERYYFQQNKELAVIEFWYNKSSQFTKIQPMPQLSNSTRLVDEVISNIGASV